MKLFRFLMLVEVVDVYLGERMAPEDVDWIVLEVFGFWWFFFQVGLLIFKGSYAKILVEFPLRWVPQGLFRI